MKIAVITRHAIVNYGALLQTIATQQVIEQLGHRCQIIDYIREDETYYNYEKTVLRSKDRWKNSAWKRAIYLALRMPPSVIAGKKFEKERKKRLALTPAYSSPEQLEQELPDADVYVTGSDQVWGPVADGSVDCAYLLSFVPDYKRKLSYAASFGRAKLTEDMQAYYKQWLSRYDQITVREDSAVELIKDMGLSATQVLDPTLLLSKDYWDTYTARPKTGKYVLVYQLHNDKSLGAYAKKVAKSMGLPLIRISPTFHQVFRQGRLVFAPSLEKMLTYIKHAECVITDSFHGTVFAMTFNTPFVEVLPNNNTGTRNLSILKLTGLEDRILTDHNDIELADKPIDYARVNRKLELEREKSLSVLKSMIQDLSFTECEQ